MVSHLGGQGSKGTVYKKLHDKAGELVEFPTDFFLCWLDQDYL